MKPDNELTEEELEAKYSMAFEALSREQQEDRLRSKAYWEEQRRQGNVQSWEMHRRLNLLEGYEPRRPEEQASTRPRARARTSARARRAATGCLYGLAYGDALGAPTEFLPVEQIIERFGPDGPRELSGNPARVTDDTQMSLAVAHALRDTNDWHDPAAVEAALRRHFVRWRTSPDNNRSPGSACMQACRALAEDGPWQQATTHGSKGCGANMRVAPVGLLPGSETEVRAGIAQLQAGLTHGHPTALATGELTALAIAELADGTPPAALPAMLREHCRSERERYRHEWLGELWRYENASDPISFIAAGWDECHIALDRVDTALRNPAPHTDPCLATGQGWIAEEALATALHCYLLFPEQPVAVLARAATTAGDSDSIACIAGAMAGAAGGNSIWPAKWAHRIEYTDQLADLGAWLDQQISD